MSSRQVPLSPSLLKLAHFSHPLFLPMLSSGPFLVPHFYTWPWVPRAFTHTLSLWALLLLDSWWKGLLAQARRARRGPRGGPPRGPAPPPSPLPLSAYAPSSRTDSLTHLFPHLKGELDHASNTKGHSWGQTWWRYWVEKWFRDRGDAGEGVTSGRSEGAQPRQVWLFYPPFAPFGSIFGLKLFSNIFPNFTFLFF